MVTKTSIKMTCGDCRFYLPVDVFKGLCKQGKGKVGPEVEQCEAFARQAKCKFCQNFVPSADSPFLGTCSTGATATFPDLNGVYCEDFAST